jgi:excisionase family DNA binding protein
VKRNTPNTGFGSAQITVNKLMTIEQCAEMLQVTVGTIYVWVSHKQIPFRKLGSHRNAAVRFDLDEIVEWTKQNKK